MNKLAMMRSFFEGIAWFFEEILFVPLDFLRRLELSNWFSANAVNWVFMVVGFVAMLYWVNQLNLFDRRNEEDRDPSAHSFL